MRIDDVINQLNGKYLFKVIAFLILSFPTYQNYGQLQAILVAVIAPNHTCQIGYQSGNVSISPDHCTISLNGSLTQCNKWNFSMEPVGTTMVSDYGLVCHRKNYGDMILIVWYATSITGFPIGWLSDRFGRKKLSIACVVLEIISSLLLSFAPNVWWNIVFRFFLGISASSIFITYVWLMESVDSGFRGFVGSFFWTYGCVAYMIFPLIIYATKNWRHTQLVSLIPSVFYLFLLFVPESPRWSFITGRKPDAIGTLKKIARINKVAANFETKDIVDEEEVESGDIRLAFCSRTFLIRSFVITFSQFSIFILYMAIIVNVSILSNNVLLSMFLVGLMETPGLILSFITMRHMNRRTSIIIFSVIGSVLIWISMFFNRSISWQSTIRIVLGCAAKILIACVNQISMVYAVELFPTSHRSVGFASIQMSNFLSFAGAIYVNKLSEIHFVLPVTIYLILISISCLQVFCCLPETKDLPLPETLEDQAMLVNGHEEVYLHYMANKNSSIDVIQGKPMRDNDETMSLIG